MKKLLLGLPFLLIACKTQPLSTARPATQLPEKLQSEVNAAITQTKRTFAPDKRVALFAVEPAGTAQALVLRGETNIPAARQALLTKLTDQHIAFTDSIQLLPAAQLGDKIRGVVTVSVASIRSEPREAAELATQALLGTPVKILKKQGLWCLVQTPDQYISWADAGAVTAMNETELNTWQSYPKLIYLQPTGYAYAGTEAGSGIVSDLVGGNILRLMGEQGNFYQVAYPDGRRAYIRKPEAQPYENWLSGLKVSEQSLVSSAKQMMGLPYLWGGTSFKAVDCSGFTKTIYFMNGMIIPRDASQQVHTGQMVDITHGFGGLKPGDLLFFGKPATDTTPERVTHVGMWIGNNEFIHASSWVRISSVDPKASNYDEFNLKRLLRVKRILNTTGGDIIQLSATKVY